MLTTVEVAQKLSEHFIKARYKEHAVNHIVIELNSLCYHESKLPVEFTMKAAIIQLIEENLSHNEKCLRNFQLYKSSVLEKLNGEIYQQKKNEKPEFVAVPQFRMVLNHVMSFLNRQVT
jgi:hypothetical protein